MSGLHFDWEAVHHGVISAVFGRNERVMNDGSLSWEAVAFIIGENAILLTVDVDTDEVQVDYGAAPDEDGWQRASSLSDTVGHPLGWSWVGTNYRGYADSFTIALGNVVPDALQPRLMFVGVGSELSCSDITLRRV